MYSYPLRLFVESYLNLGLLSLISVRKQNLSTAGEIISYALSALAFVTIIMAPY